MCHAQGDVGTLIFSEQNFFCSFGHQGCAFNNDPVLGTVVVHLQAQLAARSHGGCV